MVSLPATLLFTALLALSAPGDATRLAPGPGEGAGAPSGAPADGGEVPEEPEEPEETPGPPLLPIASLGAAAAVLAASRRRDPGPGDALGLSDRPVVVFVPGHGNTPASFDHLTRMMDLGPDDYRVFDYRWVVETGSHSRASQTASVDATADALNAYLAGLADGGRDLYLVGFSKGGAAIAEMVSRWDDGVPAPVPAVVGAAMLDPPISGGFQGVVQSLGRFIGPIPDDGGYDPMECRWLRMFCTDNRDHLGEAAGVETMVVRNPKAGITNFDDRPEGLRIYDFPDDGPGPLSALVQNPFSYPNRVSEAHESVLHDRRVAECILAEMESPGSCRPLPGSGGGGGSGGAWMRAE
jgi:hypothetical protein